MKNKRLHLFAIGIFFLVTFVYFLPFLRFPAFNLIDDGWSLTVARGLQTISLSNWREYLYETQFGRFRPLYFLYFFFLNVSLGTSPIWCWMGNAATLFLTLFLSWTFLHHFLFTTLLTIKSKVVRVFLSVASLLIPVFFVFLPTFAENYFRLGTSEPRQMVVVLLFLLWMLNFEREVNFLKKIILGLFFLWVAFLTKESSLFLLPLSVLFLTLKMIARKKILKEEIVTIVLFCLSSVLFYSVIPPRVNYTAGFSFSLIDLFHNFSALRYTIPQTFWIYSIVVGMTVSRCFFNLLIKRQSIFVVLQENLWPLALFIGAVVSAFLSLAWPYQFERYYYPTQIFMVLGGGVEAFHQVLFWNQTRKEELYQKLFFIGGILFCVVIFSHMLWLGSGSHIELLLKRSSLARTMWFSQYQYSGALTNFLLQNTGDGMHVYVGYTDFEVIYEIGLFASHFTRKDVRIFTSNLQLVEEFGEPYIYTANVFLAFNADRGKKMYIDRGELQVDVPLGTTLTTLWPAATSLGRDPKQVWSIIQ